MPNTELPSLYSHYGAWLEQLKKEPCHPTPATVVQTSERAAAHPFLSIIMRSQGNRPVKMAGALDSLSRQTVNDYELIIVAHNANRHGLEAISSILSNAAPCVQERTTILRVEGGTVSTPSNAGIDHAHGAYFVLLDDDDYVMPDWVAEFRKSARSNFGQTIYCYVHTQEWTVDANGIPYPCSTLSNMYCHDFTFIDEIRENQCPVCGSAFPIDIVNQYHLRYDESLAVLEDWDFFLRVASITGVRISKTPTSVYRHWLDTDNSHIGQSRDIWETCEKTVREKIRSSWNALPPGSFADTPRSALGKIENPLPHLVLSPLSDHIDDTVRTAYPKAVESSKNLVTYTFEIPRSWKNCLLCLSSTDVFPFVFTSLNVAVSTFASSGRVMDNEKIRFVESPMLPDFKTRAIRPGSRVLFEPPDVDGFETIAFSFLLPSKWHNSSAELLADRFATESQIFTTSNGIFTSKTVRTADSIRYCGGRYEIGFILDPENPVAGIRFDPAENGIITVKDLTVSMRQRDGRQFELGPEALSGNYQACGKALVFAKDDPQIIINLGECRQLERVAFSFEVVEGIDAASIGTTAVSSQQAGAKRSRLIAKLARRISRH